MKTTTVKLLGIGSLLIFGSTENAWAQPIDAEEPAIGLEAPQIPDSAGMPEPAPDSASSSMDVEVGSQVDTVDQPDESAPSTNGNFKYELLGSGVYLFDGYTTSQTYSGGLGSCGR